MILSLAKLAQNFKHILSSFDILIHIIYSFINAFFFLFFILNLAAKFQMYLLKSYYCTRHAELMTANFMSSISLKVLLFKVY